MRKRLSRFAFIVIAIVLLAYCYVGFELGVQGLFWLALACPVLAMLWLPLIYWKKENGRDTGFDHFMQWASYYSMAFYSFALGFLVLRRVLIAGLWIAQVPYTLLVGKEGTLAVLGLIGLALIVGTLLARVRPRVRKVEIPIEGLPAQFVGMKIVQISDLHVGPTIKRAFVERVVKIVNKLGADLVALTGEIFDGEVESLRREVAPLSTLESTYGSFYVTGNHEYYWDAPGWIIEATRLKMTPLLNAHRKIEKDGGVLILAGVPDYAAKLIGGTEDSDPKKALGVVPEKPRPLKILLAHQPRLAPVAASAGFDLQLSGHTHGGQFFPWTYIVRFFQPFVSGLNRSGKMWVYVSQGTGYWGPPVRLGARSEITLVKLVQATR